MDDRDPLDSWDEHTRKTDEAIGLFLFFVMVVAIVIVIAEIVT